MLSVKNLEVVYQDVILVLKGISINLPKNQVVALLGANGAGKTTVLRAISGLLDIQNGTITKGEVIYNEKNITNSKGLFTGFLNLTIDKAPIIPNDSAMLP